jgi:LmbE family N-acetylglucosaminyl deacetylase
MKKVMCIAAHPDDEVLGCGGTLAKLSSQGCHVEIVIAAEGLTSRADKRELSINNAHFSKLYSETEKAAKILGCKKVHFLRFPDNRMDSMDLLDIIKPLEKLVYKLKPEIIFTHFCNDLNIDHQILNQAVMTVCRPQPAFFVKKIYEFEVMSATGWNNHNKNNFIPNSYCDISKCLDKKMKALDQYKGEMRKFPHARSIEGLQSLAKFRGSQVGYKAAEAFILSREIF